ETRFSCARYSRIYVSSGRISKIVSTSFLILFLIIAILVFAFIFYRRRQLQKVQESSQLEFAPLVNTRKSVKKNTEIKVSDLLSFLTKMLKLEEDEEDDDSDQRVVGLVKEYRSLSSLPKYTCTIAQESHNVTKNRFHSILPYDHSRVVLKNSKDAPDGFINANYIDGYKNPNYYIATQGPLLNTIRDFWQMIWQENSSIIVMLTNLIEQDKAKCEQYWPNELESQSYGEFTVTSTHRESQRTKSFIIRKLQLIKAGSHSSRIVQQFHYLQWPDHGLPRSPITIYRLLKAINQTIPHSGPIVIHC
ncbi:receptor-type tyrosine-protein phosphatase eta-like, partial [Heterodontus francisci]|uniref:receptor-type tyrosine-protein phosphatase eta-like n=1 Tax=Heterodontus francisci TaxID=7792 RepID=UPI00355C1237